MERILGAIKEKIMIEPEFFLWVIYFISVDCLSYILMLKVGLGSRSRIVGFLLLLAIVGFRLFVELLFRKYSWSGLSTLDVVVLGIILMFALDFLRYR